jgi:hypothetical protein
MAGELLNASGRSNAVVQVSGAVQVQAVVFVTSTGAFVNAGTATTIPPGLINTGGQPNAVVVPQAGMQIKPVVVVDSTGAFVYA